MIFLLPVKSMPSNQKLSILPKIAYPTPPKFLPLHFTMRIKVFSPERLLNETPLPDIIRRA